MKLSLKIEGTIIGIFKIVLGPNVQVGLI